MLRKLLKSGPRAARALAVAVLLAGAGRGGALAQGITSTAPVQPAESVAAPPQPVVAQPASASHDLSQWALAASLLSLLGVAYLIVTRPRHRHHSTSASAAARVSAPTDELSTGQFKEVQKMIAKALTEQNRPGGPSSAPRPAQNQPRPATNRPVTRTASTALPPPEAPAVAPAPAVPLETAATVAPPAAAAAAPVAAPAPTGPRRAYVSSAPVNGRFRRNALQGQAAHNSIYELTWDPAQPDQTTFRVNPDPASHPRHISSYADVLEPACEFDSPQGAASRIVTEAPGLLRRVDGDDWEIVRKARIRFA